MKTIKLKTNKGAAKRFKKSSSGKIVRAKAFASHILTKKDRKRKRKLRHGAVVSPADHKRINRLIPYS